MVGKVKLVKQEEDGALVYGLELQDTKNLKRVIRAQLVITHDQIECIATDQPTQKMEALYA